MEYWTLKIEFASGYTFWADHEKFKNFKEALTIKDKILAEGWMEKTTNHTRWYPAHTITVATIIHHHK
ncbi:hypothetical protein ACFLT2_11580 [Acidobacteriota bacterium]